MATLAGELGLHKFTHTHTQTMLHCIVNHGRYATTGRPKLPIGLARSASADHYMGPPWPLHHHDPS
ncbi:hypothetical protein CMEL01_07464 [Colletotrichum melonis]|nr:hypothetical protein CMEL01_07464 [Colletotrichum melonis]